MTRRAPHWRNTYTRSGILFDRNGEALVDNRPAFTLSLIPRELEDRDTVLARLSVLLRIPIQELQESLARVPSD